jgi:hypothetical protein
VSHAPWPPSSPRRPSRGRRGGAPPCCGARPRWRRTGGIGFFSLYRILLHAGGGVFTLPSHALLIGGPVNRPHRLALAESIPRARPPLSLEGFLSQDIGQKRRQCRPAASLRHLTTQDRRQQPDALRINTIGPGNGCLRRHQWLTPNCDMPHRFAVGGSDTAYTNSPWEACIYFAKYRRQRPHTCC